MKSKIYPIIIVLMMASGCAPTPGMPQTTLAPSPPQDGAGGTGIKGRAMWTTLIGVGPEKYTDPVALSEAILVTDTQNHIVARVQPDREGYFRVELPPGEYYLSIDPVSYTSRWVGVYAVTVTEGQMEEVDMLVKVPLS